MHIEITGRMTGKTNRLINAANKKRQEGKKVVIVLSTPSEKQHRWIFQEIANQVKGAFVISCDLLDKNLMRELGPLRQKQLEDLISDSEACWFFDEFDCMKTSLIYPSCRTATTRPPHARVST